MEKKAKRARRKGVLSDNPPEASGADGPTPVRIADALVAAAALAESWPERVEPWSEFHGGSSDFAVKVIQPICAFGGTLEKIGLLDAYNAVFLRTNDVQDVLRGLTGLRHQEIDTKPLGRAEWKEGDWQRDVDSRRALLLGRLRDACGKCADEARSLASRVHPDTGMKPAAPRERAATREPAEGSRGHAADVVLTPREMQCLEALNRLGADHSERSATAGKVAGKVSGDLEPNALKGPLASLRKKGLVDAATGRGGGSWLTERGAELLRRRGKR